MHLFRVCKVQVMVTTRSLHFSDGSTSTPVLVYYCPKLSETLLSPQPICCQDLDQAFIYFFYGPSGCLSVAAPLTRSNNLFSFNQISFQPKTHSLFPILSSELWHHRLGHPGMHQLDQYAQQDVFCYPCPPPLDASIFHWVWKYKIKEEEQTERKKARAVCDSSSCGGEAQVHGPKFATTPDMTDMRLFFALAALENKLVFYADFFKAFAEATAPEQAYYMRVDTQYREWWASKGQERTYKVILKLLANGPATLIPSFRNTIFPTLHATCLYVLQFPMKMYFSFEKLMTLPLQPMTCFTIPTSVMLWTANSFFL